MQNEQINSGKKKRGKSFWVSLIVIAVLIPLTVGISWYLGDRKYYVASVLIMIYSMLPFFAVFENRKPQARELVTLAVMCAIAVVSRAAFIAINNFKPIGGIVMITAMAFGPQAGFMTGALSMIVSDIIFGQGPWTPWQMFSFGIIGFFAGILYKKGILKARKADLCIYGFLSVVLIYGGIMNPASILMAYGHITKESLLALYISGLPVDLVHAASTVVFLCIMSRPLLTKLERIKAKYGLIQR